MVFVRKTPDAKGIIPVRYVRLLRRREHGQYSIKVDDVFEIPMEIKTYYTRVEDHGNPGVEFIFLIF